MRRFLFTLFLLMHITRAFAASEPDPVSRRREFCRDLAGRIGPAIDDQTLNLALERVRNAILSDRVGFIFNLSARRNGSQLVLTGESERPEFREIALGVFQHLGFASIVDHIEIVPDLKKDPAPFAVVTRPYVMTRSTPEPKGAPMDEALFGEPVYIFKEFPDVYLIKNFSGYWGYAAKENFQRVSKEEFIRIVNGPKACLLADCQAQGTFVPAGCRLSIKKWGPGRTCILLGPAGQELKIPKAVCQKKDREPDIARVLAQAQSFFGKTYNLGGKNSVTGIDCSGLVQFAYRALGFNLARDAKQQYLNGDLLLPCVADALQPGDAIFFMNVTGTVDHTALYLGDRKIIHATGDSVKIQSMDPSAPDYFKRFDHEFLGAKRYWR